MICDAAVIGVRPERGATELPAAYVVLQNPSADHDHHKLKKQIQDYVAERVNHTKDKLRGSVCIINMIPRSLAGKILKRLLRERLIKDDFPDNIN